MYKAYAGIGSRQTPIETRYRQIAIAQQLADMGFTLRSGGADGSDTNFEEGAPPHLSEIYVPWNGFNKRWAHQGPHIITPDQISPEATAIAKQLVDDFHPAPSSLTSNGGRKMMQRNGHQVLGKTMLDPVKFVLCYATGTERKAVDGKYRIVNVAGGTGQAVRIAAYLGIPVFNMQSPTCIGDLMMFLYESQLSTA